MTESAPDATLQVNTKPWLENLLKTKCGFPGIRDFQLQHGMDLIEGRDVFLVVAPGQGKTTVLLAPLLAARERGESGIAIVIVPTKTLAEQTAETMASRGLRALAINEDTVRESAYAHRDLYKELASGADIRIGVMSPQMLRSRRMSDLIGTTALKQQVRWLFVDEAHLLVEESTDWRASYSTVKYMRARLLATTVWAAVTGTATPAEAKAVARQLGFKENHYVDARYSVDRPHIKYITRFMAFPSSGDEFFDLAFLIPPNITAAVDIPHTLVFCETIELGSRVMAFLDRLLPDALPSRSEVVKTYNSLMPRKYRHDFMWDMQHGTTLRIGICTDTCTYGLDVPRVRRVVNYGLCTSFSTEKQRLCRVGRDGQPAVAYSIVPSWVKEAPSDENSTAQAKENAARRDKLATVVRQWHNPSLNQCSRQTDLEYNGEIYDEQAHASRCCSIHQPSPEEDEDQSVIQAWLTKLHGNSKTVVDSKTVIPRSDGTHRALEHMMVESLTRMLLQWRGARWLEVRGDCRDKLAVEFLSTPLLLRIAQKAHVCTTLERLKLVIGHPPWPHFSEFGDSLLSFLTQATTEFDAIFQARKKAAADTKTEVPSDTEILADRLNTTVGISGLRIVIPSKRGSSGEEKGDTKRTRKEKENV